IKKKRTIPDSDVLISDSHDLKYYELLVDIKQIHFTDHPLINQEEYYCIKLKNMVEQFNRKYALNLVNYYKKRVRAFETELIKLREIAKILKEKIDEKNKEDEENNKEDKEVKKNEKHKEDEKDKQKYKQIRMKMSKIRQELKLLRHQIEQEESGEIGLLNSIMDVWSKIKEIR